MNTIPRLDNFVIEYAKKKVSTQLNELKSSIDESIIYFGSQYIDIGIINKTFSTDDFETYAKIIDQLHMDKFNAVIEHGYGKICKINQMLQILEISDTSQTNKYKYNEASKSIFSPGEFLNYINETCYISIDKNIEQFVQTSKIFKNWGRKENGHADYQVEKMKKIQENRMIFTISNKVNIFNHYMNIITTQLCKLMLILKNTYVD